MPPNPIHLLLGVPLDWAQSHVACAVRDAYEATWDRALVTCSACVQLAREPCTCGPTTTPCPTCRAWSRTHRSDGSKKTGGGMTITSEKQFQEEVRKLAKACGWRAYHQFVSLKSPAGYPDLTLIRDTRCLWAELKMPGKDPTPAQQEWLDALRQVRTVETHLWRPDDMGHILALLR